MSKKILFLIYCFVLGAVFFMLGLSNVQAATFSLSPSSGTYEPDEIFSINIILNTESQDTQGVDIQYLNYDPALLEVQDADSAEDGIQVSDGGLYSRTQVNLVDTGQGKINFSQLTSADETYNGQGTLATITFKVLAEGIASLTFDFEAGQTDDCNVASDGQDLLSAVTNGSYTLGSPAAPPLPPNDGGSWTPPDLPDNVLNLIATPGDGQITLAWTNPPETYFERVNIIRNPNGYPTSRNNGTEVYRGSATSYLDTDLINNDDYYYKVYSYNSNKGYSSGVSVMTRPTATSSPPVVLGGGTLIKGADPKVYVIEDGQKRWITTAQSFTRRGYQWSNIIALTDQEIAAYADGINIPFLIRAEGNAKVYVIDKGLKRHILSVEVFDSYNYQWAEVETVTLAEKDSYQRAKHIKLTNDEKVYYITNTGLKRHIISSAVFNSYGNRWDEIVIVNQAELDGYPVNDLVQAEGDFKVYQLTAGKKKWIASAEAFDNNGFDWSKITPINQTEFNAYLLGETID